MSTQAAQVTPEERALGNIRKPVHSEVLIFSGRRYSFIVVQDENPRIEWTREGERGELRSVSFSRIVGARMDETDQACFNIYFVPKSTADDTKGELRVLKWLVPSGHRDAILLCDALDCLIRGLPPGSEVTPRKMAAFVNPFSGTGSSMDIWNQVKRVFSIARITIDEIITTHQGHAEELCKEYALKQCRDGIVVVSGDGLFHEVVNGLLSRPDWTEATHIPLGIIPAGSGNGMARSLEAWNPMLAALSIVKGQTEQLDTWSVVANQERRFAILGFEWGVIASIDFDSEAVRFLGGARFHLWAFLKLTSRQSYQAKLSYIPGEENLEANPRWQNLQNEISKERALRGLEAISPLQKVTPRSRINSIQGMELTDSSSSAPAAMERQSPSDSFPDSTSSLPTSPAKLEDLSASPSKPIETEETSNHPPSSPSSSPVNAPETSVDTQASSTTFYSDGITNSNTHLSNSVKKLFEAIEDPVYGNGPPLQYLSDPNAAWHTTEGNYMLVLGSNTTHMAHMVHSAPKASLSDGLLDLQLIRKPNRSVLFKMIMAMEDGSHAEDPDVEHIKAKAFKLQPLVNDDKHKLMGIDGEKLVCDLIQVEVHPKLLRIFCDPAVLTEAILANKYSLLSKERALLEAELDAEIQALKYGFNGPAEDKPYPSISKDDDYVTITKAATEAIPDAPPNTISSHGCQSLNTLQDMEEAYAITTAASNPDIHQDVSTIPDTPNAESTSSSTPATHDQVEQVAGTPIEAASVERYIHSRQLEVPVDESSALPIMQQSSDSILANSEECQISADSTALASSAASPHIKLVQVDENHATAAADQTATTLSKESSSSSIGIMAVPPSSEAQFAISVSTNGAHV